MTVPSRLSKEPPIDDWSREQHKLERRRNRRIFLREYLSFIVGTTATLVMVVFSIWLDWNLWVIGSAVAGIGGLVIAYHTRHGLGSSLGWTANWVCVIMALIYGCVISGAFSGSSSSDSTITVMACHIESDGPDGYPLLVTSKGTYTISEGKYNGVTQPSASGAASMLVPGHTYRLNVSDTTYVYAKLTGGKEVPNTGQKCRKH